MTEESVYGISKERMDAAVGIKGRVPVGGDSDRSGVSGLWRQE